MPLSLKSRTVHGIVEELAAIRADNTFLYFEDSSFSYSEINQAANKVAAGLQNLGVQKNTKVAIMMANCPEFLFSWFGASKLGAVEVPVNTAHKGEILAYMLNQSEAEVIVMGEEFAPQLSFIINQLTKLKTAVIFGENCALAGINQINFKQLIDNTGVYREESVTLSDPAAMMFTSGTTGPSKGAVVPQNYQVLMAEFICEMGNYTESDCLYNALPLFHGNAQTLSTMPALIAGAKMVLVRKFSASNFWPEVKKYQCTEFNYIGGILPILLKAEPKADDADNPLRVMVGAGANRQVYKEFERRFNVKLTEGYGMSEIGCPLMSTPDAHKAGSCGKLNPAYQVRLVDDEGNDVGVNTPGEILIRPLKPYSMMLEYYQMPEQTVEAWRDLWFHTGDYLQCDDEGFYYFVDRKKDALRRRGENISSFEVERGINAHPAVLESAAVAVKSELGEDEVMIVVTCKPNQAVSPEALIDYCRERMAYFMVPRYVRFVESLPKTPTERVQKFKLREEGVTGDTFDRGDSQQERKAS